MASHPSLSSCPIPFKAIEIAEEGDSTPRRLSDYDDLISALPVLAEGPLPLRNYQGCWWSESSLPGVIAIQRGFTPRPSDLFLCSYPKSGTTWTKALTFAAMTRAQYPLARHPLLSLNPHDCVPYIDKLFAVGQAHKVEALPSPRILATHLPFALLPDSVTRSATCRFVYVCRDPKDVLVSYFHYFNGKGKASDGAADQPIPFSWYYDTFSEGKSAVGPIWEHVLGYWRESLSRSQDHDRVLFLKYEEMLEDPVANVKRLAEFVGCPFSAEEEEEGVVEEIISLCSLEKLKTLEVNKTGSQTLANVANAAFFRKGAAGDWRNHMTLEMAKRLDEIVLEKIKGCGLTLPGVGIETLIEPSLV